MSIEVSLRARRTQRGADPLQARQHAAKQQQADWADQQSAHRGSRAYPGHERARARRDTLQHRLARTRSPLALGCDLTLEILHGLGVLGRHDARLIQPLVAHECQAPSHPAAQVGISLGELVRRAVAHAPAISTGICAARSVERALVLLPRAAGRTGRAPWPPAGAAARARPRGWPDSKTTPRPSSLKLLRRFLGAAGKIRGRAAST